MKRVYGLEIVSPKDVKSIFLAGPTYRSDGSTISKDSWRNEALALLEKHGFDGIVYIPEFRDGVKPSEWTYSRQVDWESKGLDAATVILFWIPRDLNDLPAFTTNIEFGEWMKSGKIVIGAPPTAPKNEYLKERCSRLDIEWHDVLENTVKFAINKAESVGKPASRIWFTADTHFGEERTRQLSRRPFDDVMEMNCLMVSNWNIKVSDRDIIYHLGDFGTPEEVEYLNFCQMFLLPGNYDTSETISKILAMDNRVKLIEPNTRMGIGKELFTLIHSPDSGKEVDRFYLYGHIHRLGMVKRNGLNVGVDCHDFAPVSLETVVFYKNAIEKHYDGNVFMERIGGI